MSYELQAVIAEERLLRAAVRDLAGAGATSLGQGLALMVMTDRLFDAVTDGSPVGDLGFWLLPGGFERTLAGWSTAGPVAYVEADFFGGVGEQLAAVWADGARVWGPLHTPVGQPFPAAGSPISQALRRLGAVAHAGGDEFSAVGLDRHRFSEDWTDDAGCQDVR
ncbi:hypothetical protein [Actinacidiphila bryophytorum]|uniref:Uncharacterized protein n=1 Tax=Actinacidiphila bryophytorum TaxID=1436133 RepID=A0A9W4H1P7_9ACTN|nr:hypothetical protein [Actinacidiphila bryophytorum]MBM9435149.1 hypothetical protein [Actinacidiphila bryophytorum]MBN6541529.1 hypothetical protein [Actinacidiphila bryophytorum]CAG7643425.1 conserved hypothetical protein [Actinacidiphila bryophytorum]